MGQVIYYFSIIAITFICGFSVVLLSKKLIRGWIPMNFTIGTAILILVSFWVSYFNSRGLRPLAGLIVVILLSLSVTVFIWKRKRIKEYVKSFTKGDFLSVCLCICAGILPLAIHVIYGAEFPYCDGFTYVCNADYLMDNGYNIAIDSNDMLMHPWLSQTMLYQKFHFRIGAQMLLALFSSLFRVEMSIDLFLPIISYGVMLIGMGAWLLVEENYNADMWVKIVAVSMTCFNVPVVLWNALYGFLPQTLGSALFVASCSFFLHCDKWKEDLKWNILIVSLITGCFALTYNEMLPFLVLVVFVIAIVKIVICKANVKIIIGNIALCGVLSIFTIAIYFPGMVRAILSQLGAVVGMNQEKGLMTYLSYFFSIVPAEYSYRSNIFDGKTFLYESITMIVFVVTILGYCKSEKEVKREYVYISLPFLALYIWFAFFDDNPYNGATANTWSIFKTMQYYFTIAAPFIGIFLCEYLKRWKVLLSIFVLGFVMYNGTNAISYAHDLSQAMMLYTGNEERPLEEYYKLYQKYGEYGGTINLIDVPVKHRQMIVYYLKNVDLISDWETDDYLNIMQQENLDKKSLGNAIMLTYAGDEEVEKNRIIVPLYQDSVANMVEMKAGIAFIQGVYGEEADEMDAWRWCEDKVTMDVYLYNDLQSGFVEFDVWPVVQDGSKIIASDISGNVISEIQLSRTEFTHVSIPVSSYENVTQITLLFEGEKQEVSDIDARNLSFRTKNWNINLK